MKTSLCLFTLLLASAMASADTTYVAASAKAIPGQFAKLQAGDTLLISPGTYNYVNLMSTVRDGTADKRIVVRAAAPNTVFILTVAEEMFNMQHRYYTIENLNLAGKGMCNHFFKFNDRAQYIHIRNCVMVDFGETSMKAGAMNYTPDSIFPGDYSIVEGCELQSDTLGLNDNGNGFNLNGPEHFVIRNNWIHDLVRAQGATSGGATYSGFFKAGAQHNIIENNILGPGSAMMGFCFGGGCTGGQFMRDYRTFETNDIMYRNNVLVSLGTTQHDCGTHTNRKVYHNTIINCSGGISVEDSRNNLILGGSVTSTGSNNYTGNYSASYFWDPTNRNYALKSTATALIAKVARLDSVLLDRMGTTRPATCAYGAYEPYDANPGMSIEAPSVLSGTLPNVLSLDIQPNPATSAAAVHFALGQSMKYVEVGIYDLAGRTIRLLYDGPAAAGAHSLRWDGKGHTTAPVAPGVYLLRLRVDEKQTVKRFTFVR